jgi:hypothetical protein
MFNLDVAAIDKLYPLQFAIFDKRVLLPLDQLPDAVLHEAQEHITEEELRTRASQGWFPLLPRDGTDDELGSPLYAPSRIGMLLKLQRDGYTTDELESVARWEESLIDDLLTVGDMAYFDDDLDTLIAFAEACVIAVENSFTADSHGRRTSLPQEEMDSAHRRLAFFRRLRAEGGIPEHRREHFHKSAYRVRCVTEGVRLELLHNDRAKIRCGYSPFVMARRTEYSNLPSFKEANVVVKSILWPQTVNAALAHSESRSPVPIRVPGFVLHGERVVPTKTLRPSDYAARWNDSDLDDYLQAWASATGEHRCLNCFDALDDQRKKFCNDKCRNAAKQRRYRERNPEAAARAQQRYWQSLDS